MLELSDVRHQYHRNSRWILEGITLSIDEGQRVGIWGDNGSGKSTLVKTILGLVHPTGGVIRMRGRRVLPGCHFQDVGYVGDPGMNDTELGLPLDVSVGDLLEAFDTLHAGQLLASYTRSLRDWLRVDAVKDRWTNNLSQGERKRIMLVMALGIKRRLLILDEPTEGLDQSVLDYLLTSIAAYLQEFRCALLLVSHRQDELAVLTQDIYRMHKGQLQRVENEQLRVEWSVWPSGNVDSHFVVPGAMQWQLRQHLRDTSWTRLDLKISRIGINEKQ